MTGPRGDAPRKPTLEDVARAAGVSRALVSIVMREAPGASDETRARVQDVARELGYRPDARARLLAKQATRLIGVVYRVDALHHADLLASIYDEAEAAGYEIVLSGRTEHHDERKAVDALLDYRCDAVLILGTDLADATLNQVAKTVPLISVGRRVPGAGGRLDAIRSDDPEGVRQLVAHLAGMGHRDIVHVDGGVGTISADRRKAYRTAMTALGLRDHCNVITGDGRREAGVRAADALLEMDPRPTAVVCFNDETALGLMRQLVRKGYEVPGDVAVVGFDGSRLSKLAVRELTTIRQDVEALGRASVRRAIERLEGEDGGPQDVVLPVAFIDGETTSAPRPAAGA